METYTSIKSYIAAQPKEKQAILKEMYQLVKAELPSATEAIKYGMPTFVGKGNILHFAAMKGHLGFYPASTAIEQFRNELVPYSTSKGCVRFPYDKSLPTKLISKMVKFRAKEDSKS